MQIQEELSALYADMKKLACRARSPEQAAGYITMAEDFYRKRGNIEPVIDGKSIFRPILSLSCADTDKATVIDAIRGLCKRAFLNIGAEEDPFWQDIIAYAEILVDQQNVDKDSVIDTIEYIEAYRERRKGDAE